MLVLFLLVLFGSIAISLPITYSLMLTSVFLMIALNGNINPLSIARTFVGGIDSFPMVAAPLFVLLGEIMNSGGMSVRIVDFARTVLGHIRGGFGYAGVLAAMIFAGVSGSAVADTTAVGSIILPVMNKHGYNAEKSAALICCAGCTGPIIPPTLITIIYGIMAEVSVSKMLIAGVIPGVAIGLSLMLGWFFHCRKMGYEKAGKRATLKEVAIATKDSIYAIVLPILIMGVIIFGIATPTEAAVFGVVYAFIVCVFVYKEFKLSYLPAALLRTVKLTTLILFIIGGASSAAYLITIVRIPELIYNAIINLTDNIYVILIVINIFLFLVGCVMDMLPALLILTPILLPVITKFGIDPIHFGIIMTVNLSIGLVTPPVGNVLYAGSALTGIDPLPLARAILLSFLMFMFGVLIVVTYVPSIVMLLPNLL